MTRTGQNPAQNLNRRAEMDLRSPKQIARERQAMAAIVFTVVVVACLTLANAIAQNVWG